MLPITLPVSGSTSQTRPPGPPASGLGSSTYSQPDSGLAQFSSTSMFEFRDASVCAGAPIGPSGAPAQAGRAAKPSAKDKESRQNTGRRFAFIHCSRNSRFKLLVCELYSNLQFPPEFYDDLTERSELPGFQQVKDRKSTRL